MLLFFPSLSLATCVIYVVFWFFLQRFLPSLMSSAQPAHSCGLHPLPLLLPPEGFKPFNTNKSTFCCQQTFICEFYDKQEATIFLILQALWLKINNINTISIPFNTNQQPFQNPCISCSTIHFISILTFSVEFHHLIPFSFKMQQGLHKEHRSERERQLHTSTVRTADIQPLTATEEIQRLPLFFFFLINL